MQDWVHQKEGDGGGKKGKRGKKKRGRRNGKTRFTQEQTERFERAYARERAAREDARRFREEMARSAPFDPAFRTSLARERVTARGDGRADPFCSAPAPHCARPATVLAGGPTR